MRFFFFFFSEGPFSTALFFSAQLASCSCGICWWAMTASEQSLLQRRITQEREKRQGAGDGQADGKAGARYGARTSCSSLCGIPIAVRSSLFLAEVSWVISISSF